MRRTTSLLCAVVALAIPAIPGTAADQVEPPAGFADALETLREALGIPGMAAAVVSDGEVVFAEGFGYADSTIGDRPSPPHRSGLRPSPSRSPPR